MQTHSNYDNLFVKWAYVEIIQISYYSNRTILSYKESIRFTGTTRVDLKCYIAD